jgi:D-alanyl-D-alanine dipeptidase
MWRRAVQKRQRRVGNGRPLQARRWARRGVPLPILRNLAFLAALLTTAAGASEMPKGFVYLADIDPTIQQDLRYASANNFIGRVVPGYGAGECVLVKQAAEALKRVETDVRKKGLTLKVYDCYRPARAVAAFVHWAKEPDDPKAKIVYYPNLPKAALFPDYIAMRSGHSRGATLDVTLVPLGEANPAPAQDVVEATPCTAPQVEQAPAGSLAMGTSFDCFDVKANTTAKGLTKEESDNRAMLVEAMRAQGFRNYAKEWWHYTLDGEPYPDTIFDFPIVPRLPRP